MGVIRCEWEIGCEANPVIFEHHRLLYLVQYVICCMWCLWTVVVVVVEGVNEVEDRCDGVASHEVVPLSVPICDGRCESWWLNA